MVDKTGEYNMSHFINFMKVC